MGRYPAALMVCRMKGTIMTILRQASEKFKMNGQYHERGVVGGVETITPDVAAELLERSATFKNRPVNQRHVSSLADAMRNGEWDLNGETIIIADTGAVIDGQHRLWAVIESGATIQSFVVRGVNNNDNRAFEHLGGGKPRTLADWLHIHGHDNNVSLGSTLNTIHRLQAYGRLRASGAQKPIQYRDALRMIEQHPEIRDMMNYTRRVEFRPLAITATQLAAMYFIFSQVDAEDADAFIQRLGSGVAAAPTDPVLVLRNTMIQIKAERNNRQSKEVNPDYLAAITIKAWNAYRNGVDIKKLTWRPGGANPEKFPQIQ